MGAIILPVVVDLAVAELDRLHARVAGRFARFEPRARSREYVAGLVKERMGVQDVRINYVGPVIGAHSGPGTLALFHLGSRR